MINPGIASPAQSNVVPSRTARRNLLFTALLGAALAGSGFAQSGTPLMVQMPQSQSPGAPGIALPFQLLALPDNTTLPAHVPLKLGSTPDRLGVTGQPQGMSVTVQGDMLTIVTRGVAEGQYPLRITGVWGNDAYSAELLVSVYTTGSASAVTSSSAAPAPTSLPTQVTAPLPSIPTPPITEPTVTVPAVTPVQVTPPTVTVTTVPVPAPIVAPVATPAPTTSVTTTSVTTIPTPPAATAPSIPTVKVQDIPQAAPVSPTPSLPPTIPSVSVPRSGLLNPGRFTVWGGLGTEYGVPSGVNVGLSAPVWQRQTLNLALRGTAELYPVRPSGTKAPSVGADLLLSRSGSRLYYGPSTSLAFSSGWSFGGLVGYSLPLGQGPLNYYLEGRARYAVLSGKGTFSPGFKVGFTYHLGK